MVNHRPPCTSYYSYEFTTVQSALHIYIYIYVCVCVHDLHPFTEAYCSSVTGHWLNVQVVTCSMLSSTNFFVLLRIYILVFLVLCELFSLSFIYFIVTA